MDKSPAFQFYPADFLSDEKVVLMSNQEVGCYIKLMCYCWREHTIPNNVKYLARLCGESEQVMTDIWRVIHACFKPYKNDRLVHPRLEKERTKQKRFREERSKSGKRGAFKRWHGKGLNGSAIKQLMANNSSSSLSSSSSSSLDKKTNPSISPQANKNEIEIEDVYTFYQTNIRAGAKADALKNIKTMFRKGYTKKQLCDFITRYRSYLTHSKKTDPDYYIQANNFFGKAQRWKDYEHFNPQETVSAGGFVPKPKPGKYDGIGREV